LKTWQLSCFVGAMTALTVGGIWQIASARPSMPEASPNARVEAAFSVIPLSTTTILAKFRAAAPAAPAPTVEANSSTVVPNALIAEEFKAAWPDLADAADEGLSHGRVLAYATDTTGSIPPMRDDIDPLGEDNNTPSDSAAAAGAPAATGSTAWAKSELPYVKYYVYSEVPPPEKPAAIVLDAMSDRPLGTPTDEIKSAADAFGLDPNFMKAVAKIESDFNPKDRTGSYIGLFQLSQNEFKHFGSGAGDITNPRDNAVAAAEKFLVEAEMFEEVTHRKPSISDLYLIHQQGWQGAAEHVNHPDWVAWKSMCATDEGMAKGERWCKRAIWGNTLPAIKKEWKSVDRLTSAAFVAMWRERIDGLYARYANAAVAQAAAEPATAQPVKQ
jgi:hypothetical protein